MMRIITLLNQKNNYLEKFYTLNETELINFAVANFDHLDSFYNMRDKILEIIKYLDEEIDIAQNAMSDVLTSEISAGIKAQVKEALAVKDEYVNRILAQDLEVLACIESAKSNIIRELQEIKKTKSAMGRYKSGLSGPRRLDEEV
jgi:predicted house-cleaning noncanonical NTP pyrophosphatase (MazG superfamily)